MPTFIVSLFLPYTIDFHDLPTPARRSSPPPFLNRKDSAPDINTRTSLFPQGTPPRTPAATADPAEFFSQTQPSVATHFLRPHEPRALVRSDAHIPEWGRNSFFNQPRSRAGPIPPETILKYVQAEKDKKDAEKRHHSRTPSRHHRRMASGRIPGSPRSRTLSKEREGWSTEWTVEPAVQGNGGLTNAIRAATETGSMNDVFWVGTVGFPTDSLEGSMRDEIREKLDNEYDALTVYVSDSDLDGHYTHYCKTILWPVFHYQIPDHPKSKAYEDHSYNFYRNVNRAFADKIIKSYKRGDVIWINDYHLLLVPGMVREKLPDAQIGFFLHTAFPSSEVFRCLSVRKELLEGMLGANLVAFQSPEYSEHFLTTCSRLLVVEATADGVQLEDRFVDVASVPIGIDPKGLNQARADPDVMEWIDVMQQRYKGKKLIVARDQLDNIRGVRQKLLAFELFLNKNPDWREKVVLIQVATSTAENTELAATVSDIVTRIDSIHSTLAHQPLVFLRQDIAFSQYLALLSVADVLLITSLREGMNLTCHEYVLCQDGKYTDKKFGPIILSEFTGSASVLGSNVLTINPWDYQQCANDIRIALEMPDNEKERRYNHVRDIVTHQTGEFWCSTLSKRLAKVYEEQYSRDTMSIPRLSLTKLSVQYQKSNTRVFILDYEGTLATLSTPKNVHLSSPQRVIDALNDIISDEKNIVYVMSGRTPEELERLFIRVPSLGLIAENGCFVREFGQNEWIAFPDLSKVEQWKESVKNILQYYIERVEGSEIDERYCSLRFNYARAEDGDAAARQAGDCANHINDACGSQRVHAVPVDKAVLIEPIEWSKGTAAAHIFEGLVEQKKNGGVEFLMVAGDDREDEVIFRWANGLQKEGLVKEVITVSVGKRNTEALATLTQGTSGLLMALQKLAKLR
ncbi:alpha,alpha-trehalose phosphate synthase-like protein subunit [Rhizodiscina lignyota]|uniref:Alpha,alpha-trehalose phosphate synthase-like protein subunit n=1 Tax=Rhizodiscina lignyota TaxID=1504668 RepID=A0A9P4IGH8_9PEZI|nr:alpha,alpha-trehalose phosphate synthase-like protein subunit [Rhizodiscina lignyota]